MSSHGSDDVLYVESNESSTEDEEFTELKRAFSNRSILSSKKRSRSSRYNLRQRHPKRNKPSLASLVSKHERRCFTPPFTISNWSSLMQLSELSLTTRYRQCEHLGEIYPQLKQLDMMIGVRELKDGLSSYILDMLVFPKEQCSMRHMIISGPPGVGKTTIARIIASILSKLGILDSGNLVIATRSQFIGKYIGHTAPKVEKLIRSAFGGCLMIDEAYSLGKAHADDNDPFSDAAINTLNEYLSLHGDKFVCIMVGYEDHIERQILNANPGMHRRFPYHFKIRPYTPPELYDIFKMMSLAQGFTLHESITLEFFQRHHTLFPYSGGSVESFVQKVRSCYAKRTFGRSDVVREFVLSDLCEVVPLITIPASNEPPPHMYM